MPLSLRAILMLLLAFGCIANRPTRSEAGVPIIQFIYPFAAGYERWSPYDVENPSTIIAGGTGWFAQNDLTLLDFEYYRDFNFRPIDIEVERWGKDPRFSAVFVEDKDWYEADDWKIVLGTEQDVRDAMNLDSQETANPETPYRPMDIEVHPYGPTPAGYGGKFEEGYTGIPDQMCALLVANTGNHYTPYFDFIVYAGDIETYFIWMKKHPVDVRVIDHEFSTDVPQEEGHLPETVEFHLNSLIVVSDEGIQHVETETFQVETEDDLEDLAADGWQPIDLQRTPPNLIAFGPEVWKTYSGIFVRKDNAFNFYPDLDNYDPSIWIIGPTNTPADIGIPWRMIDLELIPSGKSFNLDELYIETH